MIKQKHGFVAAFCVEKSAWTRKYSYNTWGSVYIWVRAVDSTPYKIN